MVERAEPRTPRRYSGKPFVLGLVAFLAVGTALTTYFAWQNELARQRALAAQPTGAASSPR